MNETLFWSKVDKRGDDECWNWMGSKDTKGYGKFHSRENGKNIYPGAHRVAYTLTCGKIPSGMFICHHCDNPLCCNPNHLFLGTRKDNIDDMMRKGRGKWMKGEENPNSKLTEKDVDNIFKFRKLGESTIEISWRFGVSQATISAILSGKAYNR